MKNRRRRRERKRERGDETLEGKEKEGFDSRKRERV
jgi:hypothetical protein